MARTYKKTSATWQMFERVFLDAGGKDNAGNWIQLPCISKGQAINLTQGLNACNMQHYAEQEIPLSESTFSARPAEIAPDIWIVQIGISYTHRTRKNVNMEKMLEALNAQDLPKPITFTPHVNPAGVTEAEVIQKQKAQDDLFASMFDVKVPEQDLEQPQQPQP